MTSAPKAYSYIRMSTDIQLKGDSLRRQQQKTREFAAAHGLHLVDPIEDLGVSAFRGNNVEFGNLRRFLDLVERHKVERGSYLIVESLDRLSRANVTKAFSLLLGIVGHGVKVATLSDGQIYSAETLDESGGQIFLALGSMLRAHDESRVKSQRIVAAWENKRNIARSGQRKLTRTAPLWLEVSAGRERVAVLPERAKLVEEIFRLTRDGWGATSIAKRFNQRAERGWGVRRGERKARTVWHESYIKKILDNRGVLGEFQPHVVVHDGGSKKGKRVADGEVIKDYYPRIISEDLFLAAHASRELRRTNGRGRKGEQIRNIFSGLLYCGICGGSMRFLNKGSAKRGASQWLACSNQLLSAGCNALPWRYLPFERAFFRFVKHLDVGFLLGGASKDDEITRLKADVLRLDDQLSVLHKKQQNLVAALAAGESITIANEIRNFELQESQLRDNRTRSANKLAELQSEFTTFNRESLLKLINRIAVRRDSPKRVDERRLFAAEIRRVVVTTTMYSAEPASPMDADSEMEWEMLSKLPPFSLRERNFWFRVRYVNGDSSEIYPYQTDVAPHLSSVQPRSAGKFAEKTMGDRITRD